MGTEAATEITSVFSLSSGAISLSTSPTTCGFTPSSTMSAPCTALRFSVVAATPSSLARDAAFSACFTVALTRPASNNPCFRYARSKIPPSFPVPKTANLLPASFCAIDQALLTTHARASTPLSHGFYRRRIKWAALRVEWCAHERSVRYGRFREHSSLRVFRTARRASQHANILFAANAVVRKRRRAQIRCERADARGRDASGRRSTFERRRQGSRADLSHAVRQAFRAEGVQDVRESRRARIRRRCAGCSRALRLGRRICPIPKRRPRRLRHHRVGRAPALVRQQRRHIRSFLPGRGALACCRGESS